ncbi:MAG: ATP-binding protein [Nocardioides sp.]|nr:ATP-binding protein [Nocardioides sp.]
MDSAWQAATVVAVAVIVAGVALLAWVISDRQRRRIPAHEEPAVPPSVTAVLSVLRSSAVVLDEDDRVLKASAPAYALGLVRGSQLLVDDLVALVHEVRRDGEIREAQFDLPTSDPFTTRTVNARVAPLGTRLVLALVEDRTREKRVEAVRRDFVANVSHELKTPVGAIQLLAEAVNDAADDPEAVQRFAARMLAESERLSRLVQQIIELSRLQADDPLDKPVVVDLDSTVAAAVDAVATKASARGIEVLVDGQEGLALFGSEQQIAAAIANLVTNAVTYSPDGSRVVVTTRETDDRVEVSVVDQGIGIPPAEVDRIFERFYRVDPARHRSTGGTGLGLSIVKHVAATHGGDVRVWSVEGQGSTFTLSLPGGNPGTPPRRPTGAAGNDTEKQEVRR